MKITPQAGKKFGVVVEGFNAETASAEDIAELKKTVYTNVTSTLGTLSHNRALKLSTWFACSCRGEEGCRL